MLVDLTANKIQLDVHNPNCILTGPANSIWLGVSGGAAGVGSSAKQKKRELSRSLEAKMRRNNKRRQRIIVEPKKRKREKPQPSIPLTIEPSESQLVPAQLPQQNYGPAPFTQALLRNMQIQKQQQMLKDEQNRKALEVLSELM